MVELAEKITEIDENFKAFEEILPTVKSEHGGEFALMRKKEIIDYFDSAADALKYAEAVYEDGLYSIQEVTDEVADLGYFSHAINSPNL
ncbi:MAG: hypothetical protein OXN23_06840 [Gammaproteobacteria bacterium]|nr:hypothetical protein [Gammaproteobacteria bacterium]MDE0302050.1 hypothetical protein [Gammaproteobacteria bacterium]MDE0612611.1 hypothetical protein [Gammaproteobacteria bacterium]